MSTTLLTQVIDDQSSNTVTQLDDFTQRRPETNEERCTYEALVFIVFGAGGEGAWERGRGRGRGQGGVSRRRSRL